MRRLWPLRLVEATPLVIAALLVAVWLVVPAEMRNVSALANIDPRYITAGMTLPDPTYEALIALDQSASPGGTVNAPTPGVRLLTMATLVKADLMRRPWRFYDGSGAIAPMAIPADDGAFGQLKKFESQNGSRVIAYVVPPATRPRVAARAVFDLSVLTSQEASELAASGTLESLRHAVRGSKPTTLPIDYANVGSRTSAPHGDRTIEYGPVLADGHIYEAYGVFPTRQGNQYSMLPDFWAGGVSAPESLRAMERLARRFRGCIFIIGPTDGSPVPEYLPSGISAEQAVTIAKKAIANPTSDFSETEPVRLAGDALAAAGGASWAVSALAAQAVSPDDSSDPRPHEQQAMAFVSLTSEKPAIRLMWERLGATPLHIVQVWLSVRMATVMSLLGVLFAASLVAAPAAFVYERRLTQDIETERERERVRAQARERVVRRLTELSERMEAAAGTSSCGAPEIAAVASDLDATVTELRTILGDLSQKEASS
ncbi:MAG: hypothetical protein Q7W30_01640 [Coriobacteriia bacterium]|nr:hypothetical protein [Coriobacteriia bacterium]